MFHDADVGQMSAHPRDRGHGDSLRATVFSVDFGRTRPVIGRRCCLRSEPHGLRTTFAMPIMCFPPASVTVRTVSLTGGLFGTMVWVAVLPFSISDDRSGPGVTVMPAGPSSSTTVALTVSLGARGRDRNCAPPGASGDHGIHDHGDAVTGNIVITDRTRKSQPASASASCPG